MLSAASLAISNRLEKCQRRIHTYFLDCSLENDRVKKKVVRKYISQVFAFDYSRNKWKKKGWIKDGPCVRRVFGL